MSNMLNIREAFIRHMALIGSLGQLLFYFQAFNIFWNKNAGEVSLIGFIISATAMACWTTYGFLIKDRPLLIANLIGVIGALSVITGIIIYDIL